MTEKIPHFQYSFNDDGYTDSIRKTSHKEESIMLEVAMKVTIKTLYQKGYNKSQIAQMLDVDRKTVRKILREAEAKDPPEKPVWPSMLDKYREFIETQMNKQISVVRIHEDLQKQFGIECSYSTIRDYVAKLRKAVPHAYMVLKTLPGEEAQVDFGYIGTLNVSGKPRKAWVFVMSLSYSRYMYAFITLDQSVRTFILCHINAFRFFGGVPETVKIDNLKAAIVEADFYEPVVQRNYAAFAEHYGFLPDPCRVRTPTDKGKVESNVKYIKDNCFKGREFPDLEGAQHFLSEWLKNTANVRIHGTTGKKPREVFLEKEQSSLHPLPVEEFYLTRSQILTVRTDCHIMYEGNLYSVPYTYIGMDVTAIESNHLLKVYYKEKEIALHALIEHTKGEHSTNKAHYPSNKNITQEEILSRYQTEMAAIGEGALLFFEEFRHTLMYRDHHYRSISGILALKKKYGDSVVNQACFRAYRYHNYSYRTVKKICESGLYALPFEEDHPSGKEAVNRGRDLQLYNELTGLGVILHE